MGLHFGSKNIHQPTKEPSRNPLVSQVYLWSPVQRLNFLLLDLNKVVPHMFRFNLCESLSSSSRYIGDLELTDQRVRGLNPIRIKLSI